MPRQTILAIIPALLLVFFPSPSRADMALEVAHLLDYIEASNCSFVRNGNLYDSRKAGAHIRRKYAHLKQWTKSAEDFIRYAATKSSVSGRPYQVICEGSKTPTAEWLTEELARFREKKDRSVSAPPAKSGVDSNPRGG
jgi:hypothetical protein